MELADRYYKESGIADTFVIDYIVYVNGSIVLYLGLGSFNEGALKQ